MRRTIRICITALALGGLVTAPACDKGGDQKGDAKKTDAKKGDAKKGDAKKTDAKSSDVKAGDAKAGDAKADDTKAAADAGGDALVIKANHVEPKPDDPVEVRLTGLEVVKAQFDPANIEGGTAQIEIDLSGLTSGSEMRDGHLKSADYLDVAQFAKITVDVSDIKKAGDAYTAKLVVDAHGKQITWDAVPFKVTKTEGDAISVELSHKFKRTDFGIGKPPGDGENVADDLDATLTMTLKKTG